MRTTFPPMDGIAQSDRFEIRAAQYGCEEARRMANQERADYAAAKKARVKIQIVRLAQAPAAPAAPAAPSAQPARPLSIAELQAQVARLRAETAALTGQPIPQAAPATRPAQTDQAARRRKLLEATSLGRKVLAQEQANQKEKR